MNGEVWLKRAFLFVAFLVWALCVMLAGFGDPPPKPDGPEKAWEEAYP